MIDFKHLRN